MGNRFIVAFQFQSRYSVGEIPVEREISVGVEAFPRWSGGFPRWSGGFSRPAVGNLCAWGDAYG